MSRNLYILPTNPEFAVYGRINRVDYHRTRMKDLRIWIPPFTGEVRFTPDMIHTRTTLFAMDCTEQNFGFVHTIQK